jgi:hypothetical protein
MLKELTKEVVNDKKKEVSVKGVAVNTQITSKKEKEKLTDDIGQMLAELN